MDYTEIINQIRDIRNDEEMSNDKKVSEIIKLIGTYDSPVFEWLYIVSDYNHCYQVSEENRKFLIHNYDNIMSSDMISTLEKNHVKAALLDAYYKNYEFKLAEEIAKELLNDGQNDSTILYQLADYYIITRRYELAEKLLNVAQLFSIDYSRIKMIKNKLAELDKSKNGNEYLPALSKNREKYCEFMKEIGIKVNLPKISEKDSEIKLTKEGFRSFVAFDLETTGFSCNEDSIIEIAAIRVVDGVIDESDQFIFQELVYPYDREIPSEVERLTGITNDMVKDARKIEEVFTDFVKWLGNDILLGYNCKNFDSKFLEHAGRLSNMIIKNKYFDVLYYARKNAFRLNSENMKLNSVAESLGIKNPNAHRALADAITTAKVYLELLKMSESNDIQKDEIDSVKEENNIEEFVSNYLLLFKSFDKIKRQSFYVKSINKFKIDNCINFIKDNYDNIEKYIEEYKKKNENEKIENPEKFYAVVDVKDKEGKYKAVITDDENVKIGKKVSLLRSYNEEKLEVVSDIFYVPKIYCTKVSRIKRKLNVDNIDSEYNYQLSFCLELNNINDYKKYENTTYAEKKFVELFENMFSEYNSWKSNTEGSIVMAFFNVNCEYEDGNINVKVDFCTNKAIDDNEINTIIGDLYGSCDEIDTSVIKSKITEIKNPIRKTNSSNSTDLSKKEILKSYENGNFGIMLPKKFYKDEKIQLFKGLYLKFYNQNVKQKFIEEIDESLLSKEDFAVKILSILPELKEYFSEEILSKENIKDVLNQYYKTDNEYEHCLLCDIALSFEAELEEGNIWTCYGKNTKYVDYSIFKKYSLELENQLLPNFEMPIEKAELVYSENSLSFLNIYIKVYSHTRIEQEFVKRQIEKLKENFSYVYEDRYVQELLEFMKLMRMIEMK